MEARDRGGGLLGELGVLDVDIGTIFKIEKADKSDARRPTRGTVRESGGGVRASAVYVCLIRDRHTLQPHLSSPSAPAACTPSPSTPR